MSPKPPTIAHLKGHGLEGLFVTCGNPHCLHSTAVTFAALGLADDVAFPDVGQRRFVCTRCGNRRVSVSPDWRGHPAPSRRGRNLPDGSQSFSHHRSGTCSGHGGVARWE